MGGFRPIPVVSPFRFLSTLLSGVHALWGRLRSGRGQTVTPQQGLDRDLVSALNPARLPSAKHLRYLPEVLSAREQLLIRWVTGFVIVCLAVLGVRLYQRHIAFTPISGGTYTEVLVGAPQHVNPILAQGNDVDRDLTALTYASLFRVGPDQKLVPDLVERQEIAQDQKTYTLTLKEDVRWHDGEPLTAHDVVFTIGRIQDPAFKSPLLRTLAGVKAELVDDRTVKLALNEPFAPFLTNLTFGILPEHIWADVPAENVSLVEYNLKPVGSGPFMFKSLTRDRSGGIKAYTIVRFDGYFGKPPYLDAITFRFAPDLATANETVRQKGSEGISFIAKTSRKDMAKNKRIRLIDLSLPQYTAIFFNQRTALLQNPKVREALALAVDRQAIVRDVLGGQGAVVDGPILPGFIGFHAEIRAIPYDPGRANTLLDEAGWKRIDGKQFRDKNGEELKFSMTTIDQPELAQVIGKIREAWAAVGVNLEVHLEETTRIQREVIRPRDYQSLLYGEIVGLDPDPYPFWHSSQQRDPGLSLAIFFSKQADKVLEQARVTTDERERTLKYIEFQNILTQEIPAIFLYSPTYTYGLGKKIQGFDEEGIVIPADRFADVTNWYVKTKRVWK